MKMNQTKLMVLFALQSTLSRAFSEEELYEEEGNLLRALRSRYYDSGNTEYEKCIHAAELGLKTYEQC